MDLFKVMMKYTGLIVALCSSFFPGLCLSVHAELILTAPPRENQEEGQKTYGPLAEYLTQVLGEKVRYVHPSGWASYAVDMRSDKFDIVFDAPHFGAWRMKNIKHSPVVKLPGKLGFDIITNVSEINLNNMRDLLGVKICALASPNLGTVTVYNMFENPVFQPQIFEVKGGFKGVLDALLDGQCRAAVIRESMYLKMKKSEQKQIKIIAHSKPIPEQTITISQRLLPRKQFITENLLSAQGANAAANVLSRFGHKAKSFENVEDTEYKNLDKLLTGVVWGW